MVEIAKMGEGQFLSEQPSPLSFLPTNEKKKITILSVPSLKIATLIPSFFSHSLFLLFP